LTVLSVRANNAPSDGSARRRFGGRERVDCMERRVIKVELLPHERAAILRANFYVGDEVQDQLEAHASSSNVETIIFSGADVYLLAGDLNHAIVKRGCRDEDIINLCDRFDYINDTSDGSLDRWY